VDAPEGDIFMSMALSSDGHVLFLVSGGPTLRGQLARVNVDGTGYRELAAMDGLRSVITSPDARSVLVAQFDRQTARFLRVSMDGGTPQTIGLQLDGPPSFEFSPNGTELALIDAPYQFELHAIDNVGPFLKAHK
jgi:hypothetical protein